MCGCGWLARTNIVRRVLNAHAAPLRMGISAAGSLQRTGDMKLELERRWSIC